MNKSIFDIDFRWSTVGLAIKHAQSNAPLIVTDPFTENSEIQRLDPHVELQKHKDSGEYDAYLDHVTQRLTDDTLPFINMRLRDLLSKDLIPVTKVPKPVRQMMLDYLYGQTLIEMDGQLCVNSYDYQSWFQVGYPAELKGKTKVPYHLVS